MISVIVPSFNHANFIEERLKSIFNQSFQDFEVILLDDASTDESNAILMRYSHHPKVSHYIRNDENSGSVFSQWNKGIALAKGEFIWIAESDDSSSPLFLETMHRILAEHPTINLAFSQSMLISSSGQIIGQHVPKFASELTWDKIISATKEVSRFLFSRENVIPNASAVLFKKQAYDANGWGNSNFKMAGDWWTWIHMTENCGFYFHPDPLNMYRHHDHTVRSLALKSSIEIHYIDLLAIAEYCSLRWQANVDAIIDHANLLYTYNKLKTNQFRNARPPRATTRQFIWTLVCIINNYLRNKL